MADLNEIRRLAGEATKGPWEQRETCVYAGGNLLISAWPSRKADDTQEPGESWLAMRYRTKPDREAIEAENRALAAYIAALSPDVVLALVERCGAAERDAARYRHLRTDDVADVMVALPGYDVDQMLFGSSLDAYVDEAIANEEAKKRADAEADDALRNKSEAG